MSRIVKVNVQVAVEVPNKRDDEWVRKYVRDALDAKNRVREIAVTLDELKETNNANGNQ